MRGNKIAIAYLNGLRKSLASKNSKALIQKHKGGGEQKTETPAELSDEELQAILATAEE